MTAQDTTLLNGRVILKQSENGLRASMDSVLLAEKVTMKSGERLLDMGCGTGAVGLCVHALLKEQSIHLTGLDVQADMIALAQDNATANGLTDAVFVTGDVADKSIFEAQAFNHIVMNPPYYREGERLQSPDAAREKAFSGDLSVWIGSALHWVKHGGSVTLIHRADALQEILSLAKGKFGAIEIWPVHSKPNEPAIRVIVKMIRNRKTPLVLHPAIILG